MPVKVWPSECKSLLTHEFHYTNASTASISQWNTYWSMQTHLFRLLGFRSLRPADQTAELTATQGGRYCRFQKMLEALSCQVQHFTNQYSDAKWTLWRLKSPTTRQFFSTEGSCLQQITNTPHYRQLGMRQNVSLGISSSKNWKLGICLFITNTHNHTRLKPHQC